MLTRNTGVSHQVTLCEEEVFDVSLATFYVFDKENAGTFRRGVRLAAGGGCGGCGCLCSVGCGGSSTPTDYGSVDAREQGANRPRNWIMPARKYTQAPKRKHVPRNP